jgi:hypothetical protein
MSKIVGIIPPQNYEVIRNKIAEIIAIELENQFVISYDPDFDCNVWLERTTPFDAEEMTPAVINVSFIDGNYQNEDVRDADGVYSYAIDIYARGYTNEDNIGDTRAALIVQKVIGKVRAILMATVYKTVDTGLGIVKNRKVASVQVYDPKRPLGGDDSTTFDQGGRIIFNVTAIETVEVITPNMIMGADTWVRWCCTDKGYVWINDGQTNGDPGNPNVCPPIPPTPPLGPYLRTVAVDGITITGDGTPDNPLVSQGGAGGIPLKVQEEGVEISAITTTINFTGDGATATLTSPGVVEVNIPSSGGGGSILLQTDGVDNGSQTVLNLKEGSNITLTDDGVGGVTIAASGGGTPQVNSDWNAVSGVAEILNKPNLATVATSGSYTDLINQPSIPAAQIQSDWTQANNAAVDFIKNKPAIPSISGLVPYTGATQNVDLGTHTLSAKDLVINHPSGSGVAASITKGGAGEALTVVKTSGSGNAASITGGVTLISELHLTTDLADAYIASAATWNAKQDAIALTTSGTSGAATLIGSTLNIPQYGGGAFEPYVAQEYISRNFASAIILVGDLIFQAYTNVNVVVATNKNTGAIVSTTAVTGATGLVYVALSNEVWAFGSTANIVRFNATTGAVIATTAVASLTASCRAVYDDSLVTGNVYAHSGMTMNIINATTYARTSVAVAVSGSGSFELTLATGGLQNGLIVGTNSAGVFGFDKATNTAAYFSAGNGNGFIKYILSINKFVVSSVTNNSLFYLEPTTATTLTLGTSIEGIYNPHQFEFDEIEGKIYAFNSNPAVGQARMYEINLTTLAWVKVTLLTIQTSATGTFVCADKANKTLYAVGAVNAGGIAKIIYA